MDSDLSLSQPKPSEADTLIISYSLEEALVCLKAILPYQKSLNAKLVAEMKAFDGELKGTELLHRFKEPYFMETKYYAASTNLYITTAVKILECGLERLQEEFLKTYQIKSLDCLFFVVKVEDLPKPSFLGLSEVAKIADQIITITNPATQAIVYDLKESVDPDQDLIDKITKDLENFIEPIYEYITALSQSEDIVKPKAGVIETEGILRIIEVMDCTMWHGLQTKRVQKSKLLTEEKAKVQEYENALQAQKQPSLVPVGEEEKKVEDSAEELVDKKDEEEGETKQYVTLAGDQEAPKEIKPSADQPEEKKEALPTQQPEKIETKEETKPEASVEQKVDRPDPASSIPEQKLAEKQQADSGKAEQVSVSVPVSAKPKGNEQKNNKEKDPDAIVPDEENEEEKGFGTNLEELAGIMDKIKNMKNQGAQMSDEARRKQAADLILNLMKACNFDEEDDEELEEQNKGDLQEKPSK